jgi:hypothetical protein
MGSGSFNLSIGIKGGGTGPDPPFVNGVIVVVDDDDDDDAAGVVVEEDVEGGAQWSNVLYPLGHCIDPV